MPDSSAWFALAGALGGVTLTGVLGLVTAGLNHKWGEQLQMITDQRREVGYKYLVATNSYFLTAEQLYLKVLRREEFDRIEHMRPAVTALHDTYAYLTLIIHGGCWLPQSIPRIAATAEILASGYDYGPAVGPGAGVPRAPLGLLLPLP